MATPLGVGLERRLQMKRNPGCGVRLSPECGLEEDRDITAVWNLLQKH